MSRTRRNTGLFNPENFVNIAVLAMITAVVHIVYVTVIRPRAEEALVADQVALEAGEEATGARTFWVLIQNAEQEACFILLFWALFLLIRRLVYVRRELSMLNHDLIDVDEGERIIPDEALSHAKEAEAKAKGIPGMRESLLYRTVSSALRRFQMTSSVHEVSGAVREITDAEAERMESDLSLVRYIAWAIPSVGFIGTVRGIGMALAKADQAIQGDIQGVTTSLGLAFNSTLVALCLSIVLMYFIHILQSREEGLILEVGGYCRDEVVGMMRIPQQG